jgi:hypothetical protein
MDIFEIKKTVIWSTSLRGNPVRRVPNVSKLHRLFNQPLTTLETGLKHIKNSII